jgi:cell division protease FtsH
VIQLYGGVAAEECIYGPRGISVGSQNDIEKATNMLDLMVNKLSMYSRSKIDHQPFKSARPASTRCKLKQMSSTATR